LGMLLCIVLGGQNDFQKNVSTGRMGGDVRNPTGGNLMFREAR
jgi:hypothetical protein